MNFLLLELTTTVVRPGRRDTLTAAKIIIFNNTFQIGMNRFQKKDMDRIAQVQFEEENYVKTTSENLETEAIDDMFDVVTYTDDALHKTRNSVATNFN